MPRDGKDRRLAAFVDDDPESERRPTDSVDDDPVDVDVDEPEQEDGDAEECEECGSPSVAYSDASEASETLPEKALCRKCILDRL